MLFNSFEYALFLPLVFILYWFVFQKKVIAQNVFILAASYLFYGWWDARFLLLIAFSTFVDYWCGLKIDSGTEKRIKRRWLALSMLVNLGLLGFFKYYNFFVESWVEGWSSLGYDMDLWTIQIILPVGISFYTFQTMSYSLDIYKGKLKPTSDFISFAAFVSFFPQLVAGPIERASNLLPQILKPRTFSYQQGTEGLRLILWGFFKKVVIADSLSPVVSDIFTNYQDFSGGTLILGAIFFAFQIYGDFSGYSDIAIGTAKLFGVELMSNFKFPYFSRSIAEFWRRWHISLSTWFRDYLYIPLGGSRGTQFQSIRNIFIIFLVSGFWHGANWTFLIWGGIHALLFIPLFILGVNRKHTTDIVAENRWFPNIIELLQMGFTFGIVTLAWIFFRAESLSHAINYLGNITISNPVYKSELMYPLLLLAFEWPMRKNERVPFAKIPVFWMALLLLLFIFFMRYQNEGNVEFIYFQF